MKKLVLSILSICILGLSGVANATLIDQNDGTIYDNVSGMYWYQNLNDFKNKTYNEMLSAISALDTGGLSWHMATEDDMDSLLDNVGEQNLYVNGNTIGPEASQITDAFTQTSAYSSTIIYQGIWESVLPDKAGYHGVMQIQTRPATESYVNDDVDNYYFISGINQNLLYSFIDRYPSATTGAWVATDSILLGSDPVPEPATMMLFGIGLLGLAGVSRRREQIN